MNQSATDKIISYFEAFDAGDTASYRSFYAPQVILRNGAGDHLSGADAIVGHYEAMRGSIARATKVHTVIGSAQAIAAVLQSRFTILIDNTRFSGTLLGKGDQIELQSLALYDLEQDKFARITAQTIDKKIVRKEVIE